MIHTWASLSLVNSTSFWINPLSWHRCFSPAVLVYPQIFGNSWLPSPLWLQGCLVNSDEVWCGPSHWLLSPWGRRALHWWLQDGGSLSPTLEFCRNLGPQKLRSVLALERDAAGCLSLRSGGRASRSSCSSEWCLTYGPWTSSISITWRLIRNANPQASLQIPGIRNSGVGRSDLCWSPPSSWYWLMPALTAHPSEFP